MKLGRGRNPDCPEACYHGVELAATKSLPGSYIYVITDARAKDEYMYDDVMKLLEAKNLKVRAIY